MDLFGETTISKGQLQRAALTYGKLVTQKIGSRQHRQIAIEEVDRFNAAESGRWNYKDLYSALVEVAKGGSPEHVLGAFKRLKGNGEAISKIPLFRKIIDSTEIVGSEFIDANPVVQDLGENVLLPLKYDVKFKQNGIVYCVLVLPRSEPLKQKTLNAIMVEFSAPFGGMTEEHKLVLVENPKINGKRTPKIGIYDFGYRQIDNDFREHLKVSILVMNEIR